MPDRALTDELDVDMEKLKNLIQLKGAFRYL